MANNYNKGNIISFKTVEKKIALVIQSDMKNNNLTICTLLNTVLSNHIDTRK